MCREGVWWRRTATNARVHNGENDEGGFFDFAGALVVMTARAAAESESSVIVVIRISRLAGVNTGERRQGKRERKNERRSSRRDRV